MNGCHICEHPDDGKVPDMTVVKERLTFIANLERGTPMWDHVVRHVQAAKSKSKMPTLDKRY